MAPRHHRLGALVAAAALLGLFATVAHASTNDCPTLFGEGCTACTKAACTECPDGAITADGVCEQRVEGVKDTKLTLINWISDPAPDTEWNSAWLMVNMGQCKYGCAADPTYLQARTLKPGGVTTAQGWNGFQGSDIVADVTFCRSWSALEYKCADRDVVRIEASNPKVGTPYVTFAGIKRSLKVGDYVEVETNGHKFSARRNGDLDTAKDIIVAVLN